MGRESFSKAQAVTGMERQVFLAMIIMKVAWFEVDFGLVPLMTLVSITIVSSLKALYRQIGKAATVRILHFLRGVIT